MPIGIYPRTEKHRHSPEWFARFRKPRPACLVCGKEVRRQYNKLCSISCSNLYKYRDPKNHPSWKGGHDTWLLHVRNKNWRPLKQWREQVLARDNYTCVLCGATDCKLEADHIKPFRFFPELRYEVSNGRALCVPCHRKTPTYGKKLDHLAAGKDVESFFAALV